MDPELTWVVAIFWIARKPEREVSIRPGHRLHAIATSAAAFGAVNVKHVQLADEITENDCPIAGGLRDLEP